MSHIVYRSEGIVLGGTACGEASRYVAVFTRDFGLVSGRVQSVRLVQSKLRYHLEDYAITNVGFVRGKEMWRFTNALKICNIDDSLKEKPQARHLAMQLLSLLKRLAPPDEPFPAFYDELRQLFEYFFNTAVDRHEVRMLEYITVARMLQAFGYFSKGAPFAELFEEGEGKHISETTLSYVEKMQHVIRNEINRSLRLTHL